MNKYETTSERVYTELTDGVIAPERVYTEEGMLKTAGIGRTQLVEARRQGFLLAKARGKRLYYTGAEIIRYILAGEDRK